MTCIFAVELKFNCQLSAFRSLRAASIRTNSISLNCRIRPSFPGQRSRFQHWILFERRRKLNMKVNHHFQWFSLRFYVEECMVTPVSVLCMENTMIRWTLVQASHTSSTKISVQKKNECPASNELHFLLIFYYLFSFAYSMRNLSPHSGNTKIVHFMLFI